MKPVTLTHKDLLEIKFWLTCDADAERKASRRYFEMFDSPNLYEKDVLEIGTGPFWGLLPFVYARRRISVDPLIEVYDALGILDPRHEIQYYSEAFERWETGFRFDAIFATNCLDHGEMGFNLLPKLSNLLNPGGTLYTYTHLRKPDQLNIIHDHSLTLEQLHRNQSYTDLISVREELMDDFEIKEFESVLAVWRKP